MYGSPYGGLYGGMNNYGIGGGLGGVDPNNPNSLTNTLGQSTAATFQIIESVVGAFGGMAQMLESTYLATHSSFFGKGRKRLQLFLGVFFSVFLIFFPLPLEFKKDHISLDCVITDFTLGFLGFFGVLFIWMSC
jgi:peroxin-13